jgi:hypothetical protein
MALTPIGQGVDGSMRQGLRGEHPNGVSHNQYEEGDS